LARPNRKSTPGLAPTHQPVAGKPRSGPQHNAHFRPAGADLRDDARRLRDRAGRSVDVGTALFDRQQMGSAEDVQRQITITIIIAVKEAAFLMAVQRIIGGVEIENDLWWRLLVRLQEQIDKQGFDLGAVPGNPGVARQLRSAQLQPG
jgi:hypothetical protein